MSGNGSKPKPQKLIKCSACGMEFPTISDLQTHIAVNHP